MYNFCRAITEAGKEVLTREDTSYLDSFEYNKDNLLSLINKRNKILLAASSSDNPELKQKCIDARNNVKDSVRAAKSRWIFNLVDRMSDINKTLRKVQKN